MSVIYQQKFNGKPIKFQEITTIFSGSKHSKRNNSNLMLAFELSVTFQRLENPVESRNEDAIFQLQRVAQSCNHSDNKLLSDERCHSSVVGKQEPVASKKTTYSYNINIFRKGRLKMVWTS